MSKLDGRSEISGSPSSRRKKISAIVRWALDSCRCDEGASFTAAGRFLIAPPVLDLPLLIEEEAGRTLARELGIRISGIAGRILRAVREEIIGADRANRILVALKRTGRINQQVFESVKTAIDEEA